MTSVYQGHPSGDMLNQFAHLNINRPPSAIPSAGVISPDQVSADEDAPLGTGGSTYRGTFNGRVVAVKQLPAEISRPVSDVRPGVVFRGLILDSCAQ